MQLEVISSPEAGLTVSKETYYRGKRDLISADF
jgi:hypothetical protein